MGLPASDRVEGGPGQRMRRRQLGLHRDLRRRLAVRGPLPPFRRRPTDHGGARSRSALGRREGWRAQPLATCQTSPVASARTGHLQPPAVFRQHHVGDAETPGRSPDGFGPDEPVELLTSQPHPVHGVSPFPYRPGCPSVGFYRPHRPLKRERVRPCGQGSPGRGLHTGRGRGRRLPRSRDRAGREGLTGRIAGRP